LNRGSYSYSVGFTKLLAEHKESLIAISDKALEERKHILRKPG
jgi:hypothetical protein